MIWGNVLHIQDIWVRGSLTLIKLIYMYLSVWLLKGTSNIDHMII